MRIRRPRRIRAAQVKWDGVSGLRGRVNERLQQLRPSQEEDAKDSTSDRAGDRVRDAWQGAVDWTTGLAAFFPEINVNDALRERLERAHELSFGNYEGSLAKHWAEMRMRGDGAETGFVSALKGKAAELEAAEMLTELGYKDVEIAANPTQAVWDISGSTADGRSILWQVKTGAADYATDVKEAMQQAPGVEFLVSTEVYDRLAQSSRNFADRLTDLGPSEELTAKTRSGLDALCGNLGIDIPDRLSAAMPHLSMVTLGIQVIIDLVRNERELTDADRTTKNKIAVVGTLGLMSRFGIASVMSWAGATGGAAAGAVVPAGGPLVGSALGTISGILGAAYFNRKLQPMMLKIALDILKLDQEDLVKIEQGKLVISVDAEETEEADEQPAPDRRQKASRRRIGWCIRRRISR